MTKTTAELLKKVRELPAVERRELCEAILREAAVGARQTDRPRKRIADVAGKYSPEPYEGSADHDRAFVEAIMASKGRSKTA